MPIVSEDMRSLFSKFASEFESSYLLEPAGQKHQSMYEKEREEVNRYWKDVKIRKKQRKNITDMVLEKLLSYSNTRHNREKGYRIGIAPAITKDLKKWFENAGWQEADNWDNVAAAIYDLVYNLIEKGDWESLKRFEENVSVSRGFKSGVLTPTFYFLDPKYRILNNKTIDTVNYLLKTNAIDRYLSRYKEYIDIINKAILELEIPLFNNYDIFDAFCHWMCSKRLGGYARIERPSEASEEEEGIPGFEDETEPENHWEAIYYVVKMGNLLGYKTYVADPARKAFGKKLGEIATLKEVPGVLNAAPQVSKIDVIWYKSTPPFFLFEVEDGGTMREALHRLYNTIVFDARFFIVSPMHNRSKFEKWVVTAPFKEFEERYNFRTYNQLFEFYKEVQQYISMRERFLKA